MELVKIIDGQPTPYTSSAFRAANPHTVYGKVIPAKHLNAQDVYRVRTLPQPDIPTGQKAVQDALPTQAEGGEWVLGWTLVSLSETEARNQRNALLAASDWTQVADAPVDQAAWATYRQALRDITAQEGFPENVDWPTAP